MVDLAESEEFSAIALFNICKPGVQQYANSTGVLYIITTLMISVPENFLGRRPTQTQGGSTI